jgi:hypothetical protein
MKTRLVAVVFAWLMSLAAAGMWGHVAARQAQDEPGIVFGEDIGFRIMGTTRAGMRQGTLMVRIDGKWLEAELRPSVPMRPLH